MRRVRSGMTAVVCAVLVGVLLGPSFGAADVPRYGGTLVFAIGADPETLNPALTTGVEALGVGCKTFNGLVWLNRAWEAQPELAESWQIGKDGLTYIFKLRRDVKWHDGQPLTSADVKYTFDEVLAKYHPRTRLAFANVDTVAAPDPYTVIVTFKRPYAPFLQQMTCQEAPVLPKHLFEGTDVLKNPHDTNAPVGTGPFKWGEWAKGDHLTMVRNDQYFRHGQPYLDRMVAKVIADPNARVLALRSGDIDYIQSYFLPKQAVAALAGDSRVQTRTGTDLPGNYLLFFNVGHKPLDNRTVRQALVVGLNRDQILKQAVFGIGTVGRSAIHHELAWAYNPAVDYSKMYPYNPARGAGMLDAAGVRAQSGPRFRLHLVYDVAQPGFGTMAQIIRDDWQKIGVDVLLEPVEFQLMLDRVFQKRDYDVALEGYTTAGDPAIGISRAYVTTPPGRAFTNPSPYSNPQVDQLFADAVKTPSRAERQRFYYQAQTIIAQDLPVLNLIDRTEVDAAGAAFRGLWTSAEPYDLWGQVWWVKGTARR